MDLYASSRTEAFKTIPTDPKQVFHKRSPRGSQSQKLDEKYK